MNKKFILTCLVILVIIIFAFFIQRILTTENKTTSIRDLLSSEESYRCTILNNNVYISGGKLRGEFSYNYSGITTITHMIIRNNIIYSWMDGQNSGFEIPLNNQNQGFQNNFDINKSQEFICHEWQPNNELFELPNNVAFQKAGEFSATPELKGPTPAPDDQACNACNTAPNELQAQCRASLGCN